MQLEIYGRGIILKHKKVGGRNLRLSIDVALKNKLYSDLRDGVFEGSIIQEGKNVGSWKASSIGHNPLVR